MKECNICGKILDEATPSSKQMSADGKEYYICKECEEREVRVEQTRPYYICTKCGFIHPKDDYKGVCSFCLEKDGAKMVGLTQLEEEQINTDPTQIYAERLGDETAKKIADWQSSAEREKATKIQTRQRHIDTVFVLGIVAGYFMLDFAIRGFLDNKAAFLSLLLLTVLEIVAAPVFKSADARAQDKKIPIIALLALMAAFVAVYIVIYRLFA